jgi:PHD/YefM family antitoxin component YafN of YafNO toxin-antitoxin module
MPKYLTITEAQQEMPKWPDDLAAEPAIITKDGKSAIVALSLKQFESLLETIEILSDGEFMADIMSDRSTIISRSGRVFEKGDCWQVLLANPPLQKSRSLDRT